MLAENFLKLLDRSVDELPHTRLRHLSYNQQNKYLHNQFPHHFVQLRFVGLDLIENKRFKLIKKGKMRPILN